MPVSVAGGDTQSYVGVWVGGWVSGECESVRVYVCVVCVCERMKKKREYE